MYSAETIAQVTGAPLSNVQATWPPTVDALRWAGIDSHPTRVAAIATIATETGVFFPIREGGDYNYFLREFHTPYEAQYFGRGTIQCSWSYNYKHYGELIGVDLLNNPDLALRQDVAAKVLALYFREHDIPAMAAAGNWYGVRRAINGGENGIDTQMRVVNALLAIPEPPDGHPVTTVAVAVPLHNAPSPTAPPAIDAGHHPVHLDVGTRVTFTRDPHTGREVTAQMAHVVVGNGPIHGWVLRSALKTEYVT